MTAEERVTAKHLRPGDRVWMHKANWPGRLLKTVERIDRRGSHGVTVVTTDGIKDSGGNAARWTRVNERASV